MYLPLRHLRVYARFKHTGINHLYTICVNYVRASSDISFLVCLVHAIHEFPVVCFLYWVRVVIDFTWRCAPRRSITTRLLFVCKQLLAIVDNERTWLLKMEHITPQGRVHS